MTAWQEIAEYARAVRCLLTGGHAWLPAKRDHRPWMWPGEVNRCKRCKRCGWEQEQYP